ncbi:MAG: hypothetical protein ACO3UW_03700 [Candidatus Nanopelagicales bacterium]
MAALTVAAIVLRLEGAVDGLSGWRVSTMPGGLTTEATRYDLHKAATVMAVESTVRLGASPSGRRVTTSEGAHTDTRIRVEWAWALTVDDYSTSIRDAYGAEAALLAALLAVSGVDLHLAPTSLTRQVVDGDRAHLLGVIEITATHHLALA